MNYDSDRDDFLVAGNAFLSLMRAGVIRLNPEAAGHKIIQHDLRQVAKLQRKLSLDSIVSLESWN